MKGTEAFQELLSLIKDDEPVVHANGFICRESFALKDREANFYMIGSMGLASSIGLGVSICKPEKKVIIIDGDGNVLMALGTLAMIAAEAPKNLIHVVIDNEVYESTGSQRSLSSKVQLEAIAKSSGYKNTIRVEKKDEIKAAFLKLKELPGPNFLLIKVKPCFEPSTGRVTHTPEEITKRFMQACINRLVISSGVWVTRPVDGSKQGLTLMSRKFGPGNSFSFRNAAFISSFFSTLIVFL